MMKNNLTIQAFPDFHTWVKDLVVTYLCAQGCGPLEINLIQQGGCYRLKRAVSVKERGSVFRHV